MQGRKAVLGVSVTMASYLTTRIVNLAITIILARALGPDDMGTLAFAFLAVEIFDVLRDFGLRETLIYDRSEDPRLRSTAFIMIMFVGLLQAAALLIAAPFADALVDDPVIVPVLMTMSLLFPLNAFGSVQDALHQRSFHFNTLALAEVLGIGVKALVAFALIYQGAGIWSIVAGMLLGALARISVLWITSDWRPRGASPSWEKARELFRYGRHIIVASIVDAIQTRADQMIIVAMVGDAALGLYYVAARIPEIVILGVNSVITKVVFPTYSNLSQDRDRLVRAYRTTIAASMTLIAPISLGLAASAPLVVAVMFGDEWSGTTPVLMILALAGIPSTIGWSSGDFFKATGRPHFQWMFMTTESLYVVPTMVIVAVLTGDIRWIAGAMLSGEVFAATIRITTLSRVAKIPVTTTLGAAARPLASALFMALAVYLFISLNPLALPSVVLLFAAIALGALSYTGALFLIDRENLRYWHGTVFGTDD